MHLIGRLIAVGLWKVMFNWDQNPVKHFVGNNGRLPFALSLFPNNADLQKDRNRATVLSALTFLSFLGNLGALDNYVPDVMLCYLSRSAPLMYRLIVAGVEVMLWYTLLLDVSFMYRIIVAGVEVMLWYTLLLDVSCMYRILVAGLEVVLAGTQSRCIGSNVLG